ncbi:MAG: NUDIX domain-containing protein [Legionellales bacterium]|jgi:ADP-ribose pyrophosphatase|nr:NUDIX domain-containing protein [Legionellales bacterium]
MSRYSMVDVKINNIDDLYSGHNCLDKYTLQIKYFDETTSEVFQRECTIKPIVAGVLPYDVARDKVVLIEQFRIGAITDKVSPWLFEIVAGIVDKNGESIATMAKRELQEETGLISKNLEFIMQYWVSPGASNERLSLYWSDVDSSKAAEFCGLRAEHEDIKVHVVSSEEAFALINDGVICNSLAIIALQWLQLNKHNLKSIG